jgi:hypothetical protein
MLTLQRDEFPRSEKWAGFISDQRELAAANIDFTVGWSSGEPQAHPHGPTVV